MPGYFKKRRRPRAGPNKNEEKVLRRKELEGRERAAGTLQERYPSVERLSIQLVFLSPQHQTLEQDTRVFGQSDPCDFQVSCPGRCGVGSFNLEAKINKVVTDRQTTSESSGKCQEPLYGGSSDLCGCELRCKMEIDYLPDPVA